MVDWADYRRSAWKMREDVMQSEYKSQSRLAGASIGTASAGVGLAIPTFGLSLIGTAFGGYGIRKAHKKQCILEDVARKRGIDLTVRLRDVLGGTAFGSMLGVISHGIAGHFASTAVAHATSHVVLATTSSGMPVLAETAGNTTAAHLASHGADAAVKKGVSYAQQRESGYGTKLLERYESGGDAHLASLW